MRYHVMCTMIQQKRKAHSALPLSRSPYCTVLYCTVLYCTVLYCTALYCTVLYCTESLLRTPSLQNEDKASDTTHTQHYDTSDHIRSSRWWTGRMHQQKSMHTTDKWRQYNEITVSNYGEVLPGVARHYHLTSQWIILTTHNDQIISHLVSVIS